MSLTSVERDVAFGENAVEQAKAIVGAQIAPAAAPLVSAIPAGTTLRALFITRGGEAYVDLSGELVAGHPGGSTNELLTIRTLVDALTANLPAITARAAARRRQGTRHARRPRRPPSAVRAQSAID